MLDLFSPFGLACHPSWPYIISSSLPYHSLVLVFAVVEDKLVSADFGTQVAPLVCSVQLLSKKS